ncbi:transcriptional regulator [Treponema sp. OMZ 840]|uniref:transcriptional regulator n=1 Tax=Treponema sp. OMZ 840 TaxID=244313 RepID=UPI003D8CF59E
MTFAENSLQTENDFNKARNKALFNDLQNFLTLKETELLSFGDIKKWLKPKNEVYLGMQVIPVYLIAGSEGRYKDFDSHFFPRSIHLKNRWKRIDEAHLNDIILPPIQLYEIGGLYFVRDGNHRVSVAKAKGVENIDAEVISLQSEIKLKPGMTRKQILKRVLDYEKRVFYSETGFGDITDDWNLDFSAVGEYDVIYNHIENHKEYMQKNENKNIEMTEAVLSWYNSVYMPVVHIIKKQRIMRKFKKRTVSDMYVWLITYWDELKKKFGSDISLDTAAEELRGSFGTFSLRHFFNKVKYTLDLRK